MIQKRNHIGFNLVNYLLMVLTMLPFSVHVDLIYPASGAIDYSLFVSSEIESKLSNI